MKRSLLFAFLTFFISALSFGQLSEGFETWPPADWTIVQGPCSPTNDITQSSSQANSGTYSARFSSFSSCGSGYDEYLITPQLVTTSGDQTFSFWYRRYSYGSEVFKVGWSSTGTDVNTDFTWGPEVSDASTSWQQYSKTDLPVGTKYVAIYYYSNYEYYLYIDDVAGPALYVPACPNPTAQNVNNITSSGADLGWTDASGSHWDIYVTTSGGTAPTQTTTPTVNDVDASQNPYTWSGGSATTAYDWYVRSDCDQDNTGTSAWVGPSTFTTAATPTTIPYTQDFEGNSFGAHISALAGTQADIFINAASANASSFGVQMEGKTSSGWSGGSTSTTETQAWNDNATHISSINITVDATAETVVQLDFDLKQTYSYGVNYSWFRVVVNGTQIGSSINPSSQNSDAFQKLIYDLSAYAGTTFSLSLQHSGKYNDANGSGTPGGDNAYVDNINITAPSCFVPSGLVATELTATTARLSWNPATSGTGYDWEIVPLGNAQGTGVVASGNVSDTTVVASGLTGGTTYDAYVQTDCGSGYIGPLHFTTACPAKVTTFPYSTDFENAGSIANCWTNDPADNGGEWKFVTNNSHGPSGDHTSGTGYYALLDDYLTHSYESPFNLLTPVFDLSTHDKWYKVSYWAWIGPNGATNPIYFEISLDGGATWETLYTHDHSTTEQWFKVEMDLGFKKSDNVQFRFRGESIYGYSTDNSGIDDFTIEETQAPPVPLSDWAVYAGIFFILLFMVVTYRKRRLA